MKEVIFVGGTSFSGSTLLDMIIANDPNGSSLGEIVALFRPYRKHHLVVRKEMCQDPIWGKIIKGGENNLYLNLFKYFPQINFFVDSSKDVFWIKKQQRLLEKQGIEYKNVLLYKTSHEFALSYSKRKLKKHWSKEYINYYLDYFSLFKEYSQISYKQLINDDKVLKKLCEELSIMYTLNKKSYWEKEHYTFFGNYRARIHTDNKNFTNQYYSDLNKSVQRNLQKEGQKVLYYNEPPKIDESQIPPKVKMIESILENSSSYKKTFRLKLILKYLTVYSFKVKLKKYLLSTDNL